MAARSPFGAHLEVLDFHPEDLREPLRGSFPWARPVQLPRADGVRRDAQPSGYRSLRVLAGDELVALLTDGADAIPHRGGESRALLGEVASSGFGLDDHENQN